jgi:hypothetical protein
MISGELTVDPALSFTQGEELAFQQLTASKEHTL